MTVPASVPPSTALAAAVEAARCAGALLRRGFEDPQMAVHAKAHRHDPVTVYDLEADEIIVRLLQDAAPGVCVLSEEGTRGDPSGPVRWVVDPLDGTNNFLRGVPGFAVSIALCDAEGPAAGCVYDPMRDELFTALRGGGTQRNSKPVCVSRRTSLDGASLGVGLSTELARRRVTFGQLPHFAPYARLVRILGSAALDFAYVASGRFDAAWYLALSEWDVAAGLLLVAEAGGQVTALTGSPLADPGADGVLASNGVLHDQMRTLLRASSRS
jgi:myo-inositol-1(or 4)-monophosphatase